MGPSLAALCLLRLFCFPFCCKKDSSLLIFFKRTLPCSFFVCFLHVSDVSISAM